MFYVLAIFSPLCFISHCDNHNYLCIILPAKYNTMKLSEAPRILSEEESDKLGSQQVTVSEFRKQQLRQSVKKNWDLFYKRNKDHFFKDRHWTIREFEELSATETSATQTRVLLEVGCGVGNFVFPLVESDACGYRLYATDFSSIAIDMLRSNKLYNEDRIKAFVSDVTADCFITKVQEAIGSNTHDVIDVATLIFVLSAIHPDRMPAAAANLFKVAINCDRLNVLTSEIFCLLDPDRY